MKNFLLILTCSFLIAFQGCAQKEPSEIKMVSPKQVYDAVYIKKADAQLLDVRTDKEFTVSHLKNAQNICVTNDDFQEKVKTLDKEKPVYVYCKSGGRSAKAAKILSEMGFTKVYDLQGGITNWEDNKLKTEN